MSVPADYTGLPRPQGAGYDIGAFEYDAVPPPSPAALLLGGTVDGATVYRGAPATLTASGATAFSGFYAAGTAMDPVTFAIGSFSRL